MDLTEAEDIKKRWQADTEELYKKYLHDQLTNMEPILPAPKSSPLKVLPSLVN